MKRALQTALLPLVLFAFQPTLRAQTIDDGCLLAEHEFRSGLLYSHDSWDKYWEGALKRTNGNIGTITTKTAAWTAGYGLTDRLNVLATVPYVWTHASQGVLHDMEGFQDITLAGKYRLLETRFTRFGSMRAFAVVGGAVPLTRYTPDFQPLSLGSASKRVSGRLTLNFQSDIGWFLNGSAAYTWRDNVKLDRPYYFTDGQLFPTNEVSMPGVFDYSLSAGYLRGTLMASLFFSEQRTRGGGDIRRQDMPFVSNRMDFSRVGLMAVYPIPKLQGLELQFDYAYTTDGRNVGQATTITTGLLYRFNTGGKPSL